MKRKTLFAALAALILNATFGSGGAALGAQDFSGSIEPGIGWYWTKDALIPLPQKLELGLSGKIGNPDDPAGQYLGRFEAAYDPAKGLLSLSMGEAWVRLFAGPFDITIGNQIVAWGSTDVFSPSDSVNPTNLSLAIDPLKMPVPLIRIAYNAEGFQAEFVAEPYWVAPVLPGPPWAAVPSLPVTVAPVAFSWENLSVGARIKASFALLQGLDIGLTAYRGRSYTPTTTINFVSMVPTSITLSFDPVSIFAADAVFAMGEGFVLKTEWAYRSFRDTSIFDPAPGSASIQGVSGLEFRIGPVQIIGEYVLDWAKDPKGSGDSYEHSAIVILSWDSDGWVSMRVAAIYKFDGGGMIAPEISFTLADGLKLSCDAYVFYGEPGSTYGAWKDNSLGRLSLKFSF